MTPVDVSPASTIHIGTIVGKKTAIYAPQLYPTVPHALLISKEYTALFAPTIPYTFQKAVASHAHQPWTTVSLAAVVLSV